jgi:phage I-like protein
MKAIIGVGSAAITIIGFITIWIKVGRNQGQMEEVIKNLVNQTGKNEADIAELKNGMHKIQMDDVTRFTVIETKLDNIKETIALLNKGRRYAQKK